MKKGYSLGIILILIGIAWLLQQAGIFSVNWAAAIKTLWPVVLVATGASVLLGQRRKLVLGIWIVTFVAFIGFGVYKRNEPVRLLELDKNIQIDVGPLAEKAKEAAWKEIPLEADTEEGRLILQLGTAEINLSGRESANLVSLDSDIPKLKQRISAGKNTVLEYSHDESNDTLSRDFNLELNPKVTWDIDANIGMADGIINLESVPVRQVDLKLGVGEMELRFGRLAEKVEMNLWSGVTVLDIYIPQGTGLRIKTGNIISELDVHNMEMIENDNLMISENYDTAEYKIDIEVKSAMSEIEVFVQ